jgi:hypothetical protein
MTLGYASSRSATGAVRRTGDELATRRLLAS